MSADAVMGRIVAILDVDNKKFTAGIQKAGTQFSGLHSDMSSRGKAITGIIGGIGTAMVSVGAVKFLEESVKEAIRDEVQLTKLKTAIADTGAEWEAYASQMEAAGIAGIKLGFSDDTTTAALAKLTMMTGDAGKALKDISLSQDLARATGMDLASAAGLVAKVEEGRIGIAARQLPFLKSTMSAEEALAALRQHTAGQAAAYANTAAGAADRWTASYELLQKTIGERLLPAFTGIVDGATSIVTWFAELDSGTQGLVLGLGGMVVAAGLATAATATLQADLLTLGLITATDSGLLGAMSAGFMLVAEGESVASVSTLGFGAAVGAAMPWLLAIGVGLLVATKGAESLANAMNKGGKGTAELSDRYKALGYSLDADGNILNSTGQRMYSTSEAADRMAGSMHNAAGAFVATKYVLSDIDQAWENYLAAAGKVATATDDLAKARATSLPGSLAVLQAEQALKDAMGGVDAASSDLSPTQQKLADKYGILTTALKGSTKAFEVLRATMSNSRTVGEAYVAAVNAEADAVKKLNDDRKNHASAAQIQADELAIGDAHKQVGVSLKQLADEYGKLTPKEIAAAVKSHELTKEQGALFIAADKAGRTVGVLKGKLAELPKSAVVKIKVDVSWTPLRTMIETLKANHIKLGSGSMRFEVSTGALGGGAAGGIIAPKASGDIVGPGSGGTPVLVAENGYNETLINWSPANRARNASLMATTAAGIGLAGGSGSGVVQITNTFNIPATIKSDIDIRDLAKKLAAQQTIELRAAGVFA